MGVGQGGGERIRFGDWRYELEEKPEPRLCLVPWMVRGPVGQRVRVQFQVKGVCLGCRLNPWPRSEDVQEAAN